MARLPFALHAAAVVAPGITSLDDLRKTHRHGRVTDSREPFLLSAPAKLPANERRRASQAARLVLACAEQVLQQSPFAPDKLRSVFAADDGTGEVCQQMLEALATTRQVSPLLFPSSVQNAPAGYFSIAWQNQRSSSTVSLGPDSFACGLLCAATEAIDSAEPVLLIAYDPAMNAPLDEQLPIREPTATAWLLSARGAYSDASALGSFVIETDPSPVPALTPLPAWLPARWAANSSARGLVALGLLDQDAGTVLGFKVGGMTFALWREDDAR